MPSPRSADDAVLAAHRGGKIATAVLAPLRDKDDLSIAYTPGVAEVCLVVRDDPDAAWDFTAKGTTVAVVTDGTAVLGLGDIGPTAALPVMEGKAALFKRFGDVNAVPLCLATTDVDEIVDTVIRVAPAFGGINLEDISAPRCFEVERRLVDALDIPVFHDDQHGTAVVVLAALRNALLVVGKSLADVRIVLSGAGAAGVAVTRILLGAGARDITLADRSGVIHPARAGLTAVKAEIAALTNPAQRTGSLADALRGADVFIGVSGPGTVAEADVEGMAPGAVVFALANPTPEVDPVAAARHARVVATGRSDLPNQINNVLAFPGIFRGALDVRARRINEEMKLAAAGALAACVTSPSAECVIPSPFDPAVAPSVATAVAAAARRTGVARR